MESFAQSYEQLASISAVLGGLAFTAAAALLSAGTGTSDPNALSRPAKVTIANAVASTVCLIFAALLWSLMSAVTVRMVPAPGATEALPAELGIANGAASIGITLGIVFLFVSVGASGWIGSRRLGIVTTAVAAVGGLPVLVVMYWASRL